jgi:hypothetical protein
MIKMIRPFQARFELGFLQGWALRVHSVAPPPLMILDGHPVFAGLNSGAGLAACSSNGRLNLVDACACY